MKVYLRAFEPDDYKKINAWRRDKEFYKLTGGNKYFVSSERDRKWVEEKIFDTQNEIYLAICLTGTHEFIGYVSLSEIDHRNRKADWSGIVIGENKYRGHGYASQAIFLLLEHAFDELGVERVAGSWLDDNRLSLFVGKMLGFQQEGVLRRYVYKSGRAHDLIIMSMLRDEFELLRKRFLSENDRADGGSP